MKKAEDYNTVDEVYACLKELEENPNRLVRNAKELDTDGTGNSCWVYESNKRLALKKKIQVSVDSPDQVDQEKELMSNWPWRMKSEGFETVQFSFVQVVRLIFVFDIIDDPVTVEIEKDKRCIRWLNPSWNP